MSVLVNEASYFPVDAQPVKNQILKLEKLEKSLSQTFGNSVSFKTSQSYGGITLTVSKGSGFQDPFLLDEGPVKICIRTAPDLSSVSVEATLMTWNRQKLLSTTFGEEDCKNLIQSMIKGDRFKACCGFDDVNSNELMELFSRVRKIDIGSILIEKCDRMLVFRSRECKYVIDADSEEEIAADNGAQCSPCRKLIADLDAKYAGGSFLRRQQTIRAEKVVKAAEEEVIIPPVKAELKKSIENVRVNEDTETTVDVSSLRRSVRKRIRKFEFEETVIKRRGRPSTQGLECTSCEKSFSLQREFRRHMSEHENQFPCEFCERKFKYQKELDIHLRKHRGEKPYVCCECDEAYEFRRDLRLHISNHKEYKPHKCPICKRGFSRKQQMQVHISVHTGEKCHLCSECGNAFSSASTLIDHKKRTHLDIRHHKCDVCPKTFFAKHELDIHLRTHTGEKPFVCKVCCKTFSRIHHLKRHKECVHEGKKQVTKKLKKIAPVETSTFVVSEDGKEIMSSIMKVDEPLESGYIIEETMLEPNEERTRILVQDKSAKVIKTRDLTSDSSSLIELSQGDRAAAKALNEISAVYSPYPDLSGDEQARIIKLADGQVIVMTVEEDSEAPTSDETLKTAPIVRVANAAGSEEEETF